MNVCIEKQLTNVDVRVSTKIKVNIKKVVFFKAKV